MSTLTEYYTQLALSLGMRYDAESNTLHGQRDGFDLLLYAADSSMPYALSVHTAVKTPTGAAITKDEFKELSKNVKVLGIGHQDGNHVIMPLLGLVNQKKQKDALRDRVTEALDHFIPFLKGKGCQPCCSVCGRPEEVSAYMAGGSYFHLCQDCEADMRGKFAVASSQNAKKKENVVGGIVGALLGSLVGVICIVLLGQLGYVAALSGAVMAVGVLKGYELLGGRLTKKGIVISVAIMLVMTYVGDRLDWAIRLLRDGGGADAGYNVFECYRLVSFAIEKEMIEMSAYIGNLVLLYVFLLLGAVPTIISRVKEKKEEGRMVKIGSLGGFNSYVG